MTDHPVRLFADDAAVRDVGEGLIARTLPRVDWTHEAHLAATAYLLLERPDIDLDRDIGGIISRYNEAVGGANDDHGGYDDTITRSYLEGVRAHLTSPPQDESLVDRVNALLAGPVGARDWPTRFYSRERLFPVAARRGFLPPDLAPLPRPVERSR